jgi:hypothetical protein
MRRASALASDHPDDARADTVLSTSQQVGGTGTWTLPPRRLSGRCRSGSHGRRGKARVTSKKFGAAALAAAPAAARTTTITMTTNNDCSKSSSSSSNSSSNTTTTAVCPRPFISSRPHHLYAKSFISQLRVYQPSVWCCCARCCVCVRFVAMIMRLDVRPPVPTTTRRPS